MSVIKTIAVLLMLAAPSFAGNSNEPGDGSERVLAWLDMACIDAGG